MAVVAEVTALNLLARYGIEVIWKLHLDAATAHGEGQAEADRLAKQTAVSFGQIVDAYRSGRRQPRLDSVPRRMLEIEGDEEARIE